jgi:putative lipase involved disintegration of autophagic bodies
VESNELRMFSHASVLRGKAAKAQEVANITMLAEEASCEVGRATVFDLLSSKHGSACLLHARCTPTVALVRGAGSKGGAAAEHRCAARGAAQGEGPEGS